MKTRIGKLVIDRLREGPATWSELKEATGSPSSSLHPILVRMQEARIIQHEARGTYALSVFGNSLNIDGNRLLLRDA